MSRSNLVASGAVLAISVLMGCSDGADPAEAIARANSTNIQRIANLYLAFQTEHNWMGPSNEAEFKEFILSLSTDKLAQIGVDPNNLDQIFVSERDEQPYKIRYKVSGNMMGSDEPIVFESVGVAGKRMVGTLSMEQREVDSAEYERLWEGGAAAPRPAGKR